MTKALSIESVRVAFTAADGGQKVVFDDLSFTVEPGELVVIIGKSGGGKTTLLHLLAGIQEPDQGTIQVLGTTPRRARRRMGFMLARDALLPWRTAQGNVEYGLELRKVPRRERKQVARRYLEEVELSSHANLWPWQLSQGMRQRVALARTWALQAELLLLDEPFAALDAQTRERIQRAFLDLWARDRRSVVFVTHDLDEAIMLADRIVVIGDGQVLAERSVPFARPRNHLDLVADPQFHALLSELRGLITH